MKQIRLMNKKYRHIVMNGNRLRSVLMAAMLLMSGTAMADETGGVRVGGSVYGGGNLAKVAGSCTVNINQEGAVVTNDVYGGGAKAHVNTSDGTTATEGATTTVTLTKGTVGGSVYGGGLGQQQRAAQAATESSPAVEAQDAIPANVFGTVKVTVNGGTAQNVFGCNNLNGSPQQDVTVNIDGGTINEDVYGGGHEADALGQITVNIEGGTVKRDVYGGGALASTNTGNWDATNDTWADGKYDTTTKSTTYTTTINLTGGTISNNVYGGGLGRMGKDAVAAQDAVGTEGEEGYKPAVEAVEGITAVEAKVYGNVLVKLNETTASDNCIVNGSIFGCNNVNGSPQGCVTVHIFKTASTEGKPTKFERAAYLAASDDVRDAHAYELAAVYGGGNKAAYYPDDATVRDTAQTHVIIDGCDLTSIRQVYGGGNAASTPATNVTIKGTYEIGEVFGGGNGKSTPTEVNPGANVGYLADTDENGTPGTAYGTGYAQVNINGGTVHSVFGGSNTKGNVREVAVAMLEEEEEGGSALCDFVVDEAYGGGKSAPMDGIAKLQLGCIPGVGHVYGGAQDADVNNDVVLTITNGSYDKVFGGNNKGHDINGTITVNIEETGCRPIHITDLYGGGNLASYTAPLESETSDTRKPGPTINVKSCTSIDNIYGGGYGVGADVTGDTYVNLNMVKGRWAGQTVYSETVTDQLGSIGHVYGGGFGANVNGNTYVNIGTTRTIDFVTEPTYLGSGNYFYVSTEKIYTGIEIAGANITSDVFGGGYGAETNVTGTAYVKIGERVETTDAEENVSVSYTAHDATTSGNIGGDIYGGSALGSVANTQVNLYAGAVSHNVFGGGMGRLAVAGDNTDPDNPAEDVDAKSATISTQAEVNLYAATVTGGIYGGCNVNGTTTAAIVNMNGGTLGTSGTVGDLLFAGGLGSQTTTTTATLNIGQTETTTGENPSTTYDGTSTIYSNMYGGSALGTVGTSYVYLNQATSLTGNVFGGGMGNTTTEAIISTSANVTLNSATITGSIYGGCNVNGTAASTNVTLIGGQVGTDATHTANVFGGGYGHNTYVKGDVKVNVGEDRQSTGGTTIYGDVYGGSAQGYVNAYLKTTTVGETTSTSVDYSTSNSTTVNLNAGIIYGDAYGGGLGQKTGFDGATADVAAEVGGAVNVNVQGVAFKISNYTDEGHTDVVKTGRVFGCNNLYGSPKGNVTVTVSKTVGLDASNQLKSSHTTGDYEIAAVYGGGNLANYSPTAENAKANILINSCDVSIENVYGGGNAASVNKTDVQVSGAFEIDCVFGGGNGKDPYKKGDTWENNNGADIEGDTNTLLLGGTIHEAYGGSNQKGRIGGTVHIDSGTGGEEGCPLLADKIVAAGKNADLDGNAIVTLGCMPDARIAQFFGGADNADVNGRVELTITSGHFGQVFGGNNLGGVIKGSIILNIEETGCRPIIIEELYGCGNQAMYSVYHDDNGNPLEITQKEFEETYTTDDARDAHKYADPVVNIISCTSIGKVFGGGLGAGAKVYGNPTVNINQIYGKKYNTDGVTYDLVNTALGTIGGEYTNADNETLEGGVFGGGWEADVYGNTTINIGTLTEVKPITTPTLLTANANGKYDVQGANITGNVYGGGYLADVTGNTYVNICANRTDDTYSSVTFAEGTPGVTIGGNVFGGGKGDADSFTCEKAMVGIDNAGLTDTSDGGTTVIIGNGTVNGTVYGGGEIGRVEKNTVVTIGTGDGVATGTPTSAPIITGNVFGAGKGLETHGYAALVRGNPTVTIQGNAKVEKSVYGGGEIASVARYQIVDGVPVALAQVTEGQHSGYCKVEVKGYAEIGPDGMKMYHSEITDGTDKPDDWGHVFAAGKGVLPQNYTYADNEHRPKRMVLYKDKKSSYWEYADTDFAEPENATAGDLANQNVWEYFPEEKDYFDFIETLALATQTEVTIGGHAFVKGSVYGGSENGLVQYDTQVNIEDECQIGSGDGVNRRYTTAEWTYDGSTTEKSLAECAHWDYVATSAAPYDPHAKYLNPGDGKYYYDEAHTKYAEGGRRIATDGHTYYGNVFGGGSGSVPYFDTTNGVSRYIMTAGQVKGNTNVTISGGHILTNVYGGCEATNVLGEATVKMSAGTLGVPRTLAQIDAHPVTCYLFGAGKGDQRIFFNKDTNVENVKVEITGGKIFGSVFGGGEDGHVHRDVTMTIGKDDHTGPTIGNWGTSYVDGNIFGGGRGFGGDAYTAGNVAGSITMEIKGGDILGSIYGGGRLGSVGYGLFDAGVSGYGEMRPDNTVEDSNPTSATNFKRGYVNITISGGTIGNTLEYKVPNATNITAAGISETDISKWTATEWTTWKNHYNIPKTEFDSNGHLTHTKGGNVFTGGMGRFYQLDGTTPISSIDWWKLGNVKTTTLTITGGEIKSSVYGGGELGMVQGGTHTSEDNKAVSTEINVSGGIIGTEVMDGETVKYTFGSVFGGGYGSLLEKLTHTGDKPDSYPKYIAGRVKGSTEVTISGTAKVRASVYGGGEMAAVGESKVLASQTDPVVPGETLTGTSGAPMEANTYVTINGGTIGKDKDTENTISYGGATMGNVYGGGSGSNNTVRSGHVYGNTNVTITDGTIYHNVYGGGAYGTVGDFTYNTEYDADAETKKVVGINDLHTDRTGTGTATINITGGTIGVDGHENGMVFGSSRGDINKPRERDDYTAWVYNANVTIGTEGQGTTLTTPLIKGSVYGSGENGHTYNNTIVTVNSGTIGDASDASYAFRGNVYGGGCGTDKYYSATVPDGHKANDGEGDSFNTLAGVVYGTTTVNINGGQVVRNVYGAGAMGSVGKAVSTSTTEGETTTTTTTVTGGTTTINVSDGTIGVDGTAGDGNVFGAARGDVDATINEFALVRKETNVSVTGGTIKGNVYGGGELGCVGTFTHSTDYKTFTWKTIDGNDNTDANDKNTGLCNVTINGGSAVINGKVFGAGKGKEDSFWCEKGIAYSTNVEISDGTVNGNVYGGGEVGRVETDTEVKIGNGAGTEGGTSTPTISGSVFGGGAGVETHGYSALVRGNTQVTVEGNAQVAHSVYGGGEIASVGRYGLDAEEMPSILQGGGDCKVTIQGYANIGTDVFGAGKGVTPKNYTYTDNEHSPKRMILRTALKEGDISEDYETGSPFVWHYLKDNSAYETYLETLALATAPDVTIGGNATVNGSVFGGGELGLTKGSVAVNIIGGTITEDVYGGGSLANTNTTNQVDNDGDGVAETTVDPTTTVNLLGGTVNRNVYGGGLGRLEKGAEDAVLYTADDEEVIAGTKQVGDVKTPAVTGVGAVEALVFGDVTVNLNGLENNDYVEARHSSLVTGLDEDGDETTDYYRVGNDAGCTVNGNIFGCNNINGTPKGHTKVHVFKTKTRTGKTYDVDAVFGGGNNADYKPADTDTKQSTEVIIEGCDLTSIENVYGGGNAAATPGTEVLIKGTKIINQLFGGGNGTEKAANVGYDSNGSPYTNGTGKAVTKLMAGYINYVYGGSNSQGDIRGGSQISNPTNTWKTGTTSCCENLVVQQVYGGGKDADIKEGGTEIVLGCLPNDWIGEIYAGAQNADVVNDVSLTLTSGKFGRVFGGNKSGGKLDGSIVVNIEENPECDTPIIIGELYGGGNEAPYSAYGYKEVEVTENDVTKKVWQPLEPNDEDVLSTPYPGPIVNVKSFTSIGNIYGGGYGSTATVIGNPTVLINEVKVEGGGKAYDVTGDTNVPTFIDGENVKLYPHEVGKMGVIGNIYGGGNAAKVIGDTNVKIATESTVKFESQTDETIEGTDKRVSKPVDGADIRGNVYGGGNAAEVTGKTNVVIGQRIDN